MPRQLGYVGRMQLNDLLRVSATSAFVDLTTATGRTRSTELLVDLFMDLQTTVIKPKTLVEIGAFDARFSSRARQQVPEAEVVAFEANPYNYMHFVDTVKAQGVDYRHLAISDKAGAISFQIQNQRGGEQAPKVKGSDSLLKRIEDGVTYESVTVDTSTLDAQFPEAKYSSNDFSLWIDVEGATELIFRGATKTLARTHSIFIEVETLPYWANQWLLFNVMEFLYPLGFRLIAQDFENAHQFNVVFIREELTKHYMFTDRMVTYFNRLGANI